MNATQRNLLLFAVILFTLSELFPPWMYEGPLSSRRSAGYHFLNSAPAIKPPDEMRTMFSSTADQPLSRIHVRKDRFRLYAQRAVIMFLTVGLWLAFSRLKLFSKIILSGVALCAGLMTFAYYVWVVMTSR
jgi:hypothetical protein